MNLIYMLINLLILIIPVLINVAFVTLMERKILGLSQLRLGPNKNSFGGFLQPFSDAIKLFTKQNEKMASSNYNLYFFSPAIAFMVALSVWSIIPSTPVILNSSFSALMFLMVLSLGVYPLLLSGWSSISKYAMIGSVRSVAQTVSYEISLALVLILLLTSFLSTNLNDLVLMSKKIPFLALSPFVFYIWIISMIAETNRTPFDFAEGESELVSGFNIEYGSVGFALIFMAEYASILVLSAISISLFFGWSLFTLAGGMGTTGLAFFWMWVRATYPRYRYDLLMTLAWKSFLPQVLSLVSLFSVLVFLL